MKGDISTRSGDTEVQAQGNVIYLNGDSGSDTDTDADTGHAVKTLEEALRKAGKNGTVMLTGELE